jgi:hypothetical protein
VNMAHHPGAWQARPLDPAPGDDPALCLQLVVTHPGLLWRRAAAQLLASGCRDEEDLVELIGPRDDPQIDECIALLLAPPPGDTTDWQPVSVITAEATAPAR